MIQASNNLLCCKTNITWSVVWPCSNDTWETVANPRRTAGQKDYCQFHFETHNRIWTVSNDNTLLKVMGLTIMWKF